MAGTARGKLTHVLRLLNDVLPSVSLIAEHYATSDDLDDFNARRALKSRRATRPFHVTLLKRCDRVRSLLTPATSTLLSLDGVKEVLAKLTDLLHLLEAEVLITSSPAGTRPGLYLGVLTWVAEAQLREGSERITWLKQSTKLSIPSAKCENDLLQSLATCRTALKNRLPLDGTQLREREELSYQRPTNAWRRVAQLCQGMNNIAAKWQCRCGKHEQVQLSVNPGNACAAASVRTSMYFDDAGWRRHLIELRDGKAAEFNELCDDLTSEANVKKDWYTVQACGSCTAPLILSQSWLAGPKPPSAMRLRLAVILSHLYLGLGGGLLWPYQRTKNMVCFEPRTSEAFTAPIFTYKSGVTDKASFMAAVANPAMPNLIYFGTLLLEILTWEPCTPDEIEAKLQCFETTYKNDLAGCDFILKAIVCCTGTLQASELRSTDKSRTLRDNSDVREKFVSKVICNLEHVLLNAYNTRADEVLSFTMAKDTLLLMEELSMSSQPHDLSRTSSPPATTRERSGDKTRRVAFVEMPTEVLTGATQPITSNKSDVAETLSIDAVAGAEAPSEVKQVDTLPPSISILNDDTNQREDVESRHALQARKWLEKLNPLQRMLNVESKTPIAVAILDTGISFHSNVRDLYDGRYAAYCFMDSNEPIELEQDDDGHGTHLASVFLKANPACKLFCGRIIVKRRSDKLGETVEDIQRRIANAIYHAVDDWKVKVISMSFGFDDRHVDLEEAIKYAGDHNVLLLAAAGNNGIQEPVKYPASDRNAICMLASSGLGVYYEGNPAGSAKQRFAALGVAVEGFARDQPVYEYRSGTSQATVIGAAIAAMIMQILKDGINEVQKVVTVRQYWEATRALGTPEGMSKVFAGMCYQDIAESRNVIMPWSLLEECSRPELALQTVCRRIVTLALSKR